MEAGYNMQGTYGSLEFFFKDMPGNRASLKGEGDSNVPGGQIVKNLLLLPGTAKK